MSELPDQLMERRVARLQGDLANLVNVLVAGLKEQLSPYGVDAVEYTILSACFTAGQITFRDLRGLVPVDPNQINRVVGRLEQRGLMEKVRIRRDRRIVHLRVTDEGRALMPALVERVQAYYALLVRGIDHGELAGSVAVMEKMIEAGEGTTGVRGV